MTERALTPVLRALLAALGAVAVGAGVVVMTMQLQAAYRGSPLLPALVITPFCAIVVIGGATLIRGAVRGRMEFRRPRRRP